MLASSLELPHKLAELLDKTHRFLTEAQVHVVRCKKIHLKGTEDFERAVNRLKTRIQESPEALNRLEKWG